MTNGEFWDAVERLVIAELGRDRVLCRHCQATFDDFLDLCRAPADPPRNCDGALAIERAYARAHDIVRARARAI